MPLTESQDPSAKTSGGSNHQWRQREINLALTNALKLGSSLILTWGIALVTRLYIPRFLGPERFGSLNFADAFTATAFVVMGFGLDTYVRKEISVRPNHANDFVGGIIALRGSLLIIVYIAMEVVLRATHCTPETRLLVYLYGASQFFQVGSATSSGLLQAVGRVNEMSILSVAIKIVWAACVFAAIVFRLGLWAFALTFALTEGLKSLVLFVLARKYLKFEMKPRPSATWSVIVAAFPFYLSGLATTVYEKLGVNLLGFMTNRREVGWYGAATGLAGMTLLLAPMLSWVLVPMFARAAAQSVDDLFGLVRRTLEFIVYLAVPITLMMLVGADVWIRILFGNAFAPAVPAFFVLAITTLLMYWSIIAANALAVLNHTWQMSLTFLGGMIVNPLCNIILIPRVSRALIVGGGGLACASASLLTEIAIICTLLTFLGRRCFDRRLMIATVKNVLAAAVVLVIDRLVLRSLGYAHIVLAGFLYLLIALTTKAVDVQGIIRLLRNAKSFRAGQNAGAG